MDLAAVYAHMQTVCPVYWGSHGCDLGRDHEDQDLHVCGVGDPDGLCSFLTRDAAGQWWVRYSAEDGVTVLPGDPGGDHTAWSDPLPTVLLSTDDLPPVSFTETLGT